MTSTTGTAGSTGSTQSTQKVVPLISSDTAGPLGAIHLPRLWAKQTLAASGMLADGYDECGKGFDQMTIDDLGLDREKLINYIRTERPTYLQFEEWVVQQNGGKIDPAAIKRHNEAVRGYNHSDQLASDMRKSSGLKTESTKDAVTLNMLEDLDELYAQASRGR